jgi:CRISPR/Cas system-associated exonuclease Cas4 (RecB family)
VLPPSRQSYTALRLIYVYVIDSRHRERLIELDREIHSIFNIVKKRRKKLKGACRVGLGAWGYDVESEEFVD